MLLHGYAARARGRWGRRVALSLSTALAAGFAVPAMAQDLPLHDNTDENGVDLVTGTFRYPVVLGEIGEGQGKLSMTRYGTAGIARDNWSGELRKVVSGANTTVTLNMGTTVEKFTKSGASYISVKGNGSTLVENQTDLEFTYTATDGTRIVYKSPILIAGVDPFGVNTIDMPTAQCNSTNSQACGLPVSVKRPNAIEAKLSWHTPVDCDFDWNTGTSICDIFYRLSDIRNNAGFAIKLKWKSNGLVGGNPPSTWFYRDTLKLLDLSQVYCDPGAFNCDAVAGTVVTYATPLGGVEEFTDWRGGTWRFASGSGLAIRRPGSTSDDITVSFSGGKVSSVTKDGVTTGYSWSSGSGTTTVTATNPSSDTAVVVSDTTKGQPTSITNGTGDTLTQTVDTSGRITRITMPEGNYVNYTYDGRGNVTEVRRVAKSGSGLADIVTTAHFPASCANALTCNKPEYSIDERGNRTDFTYDSSHGGLTRVRFPAPASGGTRPETNYTYASMYAKVRNSSGTLVDADTPAWVVTQITQCATAATCAGSANETRISYTYGSGTTVQNLLPLTRTVAAGDGSISATTAYTYDDAGRVISEDDPLSGSDDTIHYRYSALTQRLVGIIGPDPDGAGPLKRRALRFGFTNNNPDAVQRGTVNGLADTDWTNFAVIESLFSEYDANDRKIKDWVEADSTTYAVTQYSYDGNGRLECTAVRMNPAEFASLPASACSLDTGGSHGADRITRNTYDGANRITKVQTGYGVAGVQADEVTTSYTTNGRIATVADGENNKTTYEYDGFDRLKKTRYPDPSTAGTSSTTDYEELTYDAGSNATSRRLRDGNSIGYSYDNLNRLTAKNLPGTEPDVSYQYDLLGRLTQASQTGNTLTFGHDALGRNTNQAGPRGTVSYQHDAAGRRTRMTWPDSFYVSYDYLVTGEVAAIRENGASSGAGVLATYAYDDLGRRTSLARGNGVVTSYGYDAVSRLDSLAHDLASTGSDVTSTFAYNPASQIANRTVSNTVYAWTGAANADRDYAVNGLNQYTSAGTVSFGYDAKGNLTSSGADSYTYSSENLLKTGPASVTLNYDPLLRLYETSAGRRFAYDGGNIVAEYDTSNTLQARHVFGPGIDEALVSYDASGNRNWLIADERGSIVARTNAAGTATAIRSYDEYGIPSGGNVGRFGYTGQAWLPELGMAYYKARIYSPTLGRFMQTDPIGYGDGMNLYNYVGGDPVNFTDPTGLCRFGETKMRIPNPGPSVLVNDEWVATAKVGCVRLVEHDEVGYHSPGSGGKQGQPQNKQCPAPSGDPGNVSLSGKLTGVADVMGGFKFTGTLTDTRPGGLSVSFEATGVAVGFAGGQYDVQGTVPGFDALDSTFQISFFNAGYGGFGVSGARISRGDLGPKGAIGEISVSNGLFAPLPAGAAAMKFNGGVKRALTGNRFGC